MPRPLREQVAGGVYHVYARGNRKQTIFEDDVDRRAYLDIFGSVATKLGWRALAYCLMDNHVHHLIETPEPDLAVGMQRAHGQYAQRFNKRHGLVGHQFQGRYGSNLLETDGAVMYIAGYIARNPVRAALCTRPEDYRWSSHAGAVGAGEVQDWLDLSRLFTFFGEVDRYGELVTAMCVLGAAGFEVAAPEVSA